MRPNLPITALAVGLALVAAHDRGLRAQAAPAQIGHGAISHISVAVRDIDAATLRFADVFGLMPATINPKQVLAAPDGSPAAQGKTASVTLPNFFIELQQATAPYGPIHEWLQKHGQSVHHIGLVTPENFGDVRTRLIEKGGRWVGGTTDTTWAYVELRDPLGATLEPVNPQTYERQLQRMTKAPPGATLGTRPLARIGVVVRNVEAAAKAYADLLGVTPSPVRVLTPTDYPPDSTASRTATLRASSWKHQNGVEVELIEPVGASPWTEALQRQRGNAVHHLTFQAGDQFANLIALLQGKGGRLIYGRPGSSSAYLDFTDTLGFTIGLVR